MTNRIISFFILIIMSIASSCAKLKPRQFTQESSCQAAQCHASTPLGEATPNSGKHSIHLNKGHVCENCHKDYLNNSHHRDGILDKDLDIDIVFFESVYRETTWDNSTGDCSNIYCHGGTSVSVNWYNPSLGCTTCHAAGSSIDPMTTSGSGSDGKHTAHVTNKTIGCEVCHENYKSSPNHINGIYGKDEPETIVAMDTDGSQASPWGNVSASFTDSSGQCDDISCHGNSGGITWYNTDTGCTACHAAGSSIDPATNGSHSAHLENSGNNCLLCHNEYKQTPQHNNGELDSPVTNSLMIVFNDINPSAIFDSSNNTCSDTYCHGTGIPDWDESGSVTCDSIGCHTNPPSTDAHSKHVTDVGRICNDCHNDAGDGTANHVNTIIDVSFDSTLNPSGIYDKSTKTCDNLVCHGASLAASSKGSDTSPEWNSTSTGACGTCHISDESLTTDSHGKHLSPPLSFSCDKCHNDNIAPADHHSKIGMGISGNVNIAFDSTNPSGSYSSPDCSNLYCHGNFTGGLNSTPTWGGSVNCSASSCHNGTGTYSNSSHNKHVGEMNYACTKCHDNAGYGTALHSNGNKDIAFDSTNASGSYSSPDCSSLYCHGNFTGGLNSTPAWGGSVNCGDCHSVPPSSNAHSTHVSNYNYACDECHQGNSHVDSNVNVGFDGTNPSGNYTAGGSPGTGTCDSLYCHGSTGTPSWDGTVGCNDCHKSSIGSRRQVFDSSGDGTGTGGDFNRNSHHVVDYSSPNTQIITVADCEICHDHNSHTSGIVKLKDKDNSGQVIDYSPGNASSLEPFCLSCHDSNGATTETSPLSPFSSTNSLGTAPNVAASRIKENWNKSFGHGTNGNHASVDKLTCMGAGTLGTGCHGNNGTINAHGSDNKIIAAKEYYYSAGSGTGVYNETWFSLCFDCHSNYAGITKEDTLGVKDNGILDNEAWLDSCSACHFSYNPTTDAFPPYYTSGVTTHFADHDESGDPYGLNDGQNPYLAIPTDNNLHWLHLGMYDSKFRGQNLGLVVCTNCHSVHGSNTQYGAVHDEMGYTNVTDGSGNTYGKMIDEAYDENDGTVDYLQPYPTYCSMSCHEKTGPTKAWFSPLAE